MLNKINNTIACAIIFLSCCFNSAQCESKPTEEDQINIVESIFYNANLPMVDRGTAAQILSNYYLSKENTRSGLYWAHKGAECANTKCMFTLSLHYALGDGVVLDTAESYKWAFLASALGDKTCRDIINKTVKEMQYGHHEKQYFEEGTRKAKLWMNEHQDLFISP
ncbi:SEL1-like repeat protein [Anaplasma marginale]|uniref:hypothetical protein n=1 Tax=Anaplasma marginale TaxID=770 RepID=UPI0005B4F2A2|nr:hypothetical protein [Anaplasma marginale]